MKGTIFPSLKCSGGKVECQLKWKCWRTTWLIGTYKPSTWVNGVNLMSSFPSANYTPSAVVASNNTPPSLILWLDLIIGVFILHFWRTVNTCCLSVPSPILLLFLFSAQMRAQTICVESCFSFLSSILARSSKTKSCLAFKIADIKNRCAKCLPVVSVTHDLGCTAKP